MPRDSPVFLVLMERSVADVVVPDGRLTGGAPAWLPRRWLRDSRTAPSRNLASFRGSGELPAFRHVEDCMRKHSAPLWTGVGLAVMLGLLWQAAFSVAMLADYWRNDRSFYMPHVAGAWPYVH